MKGRPPRYNPNSRASADECPCNGCVDDREVGCHGKCRKYSEWRQRLVEEGRAIKKIIADEANVTAYQINQYIKTKRRRNDA